MRSSKAPANDPVGKKGVGGGMSKLMSVLHQNAATLVNSKSELNGPDQVLTATDFYTCRRNQAVKLRKEEQGLGAEQPISVPTILQEVSERYPSVHAMKAKDKTSGEWKHWTYQQFQEEVMTVSKAFIETGLHRHHSVAIIGSNSPQWVIANLAAISAGGISAGICSGMSGEDIARICIDCKADIIVVEHEALLKKILLIQHKLPELKVIIQFSGEPPISDKRRLHRTHQKQILSWQRLLEVGKSLPENKLDDRLKKVSINQCCTLVYTSGSAGPAKGVMLSHDNLTWTAKVAQGFIRAPGFNSPPSPGEEVILSFSPLCHVSTQVIDIYYMISVAGTTVFPGSDIFNQQELFWKVMAEVQPTILYGPPVIFERIYHKLKNMRRSMSGFKKFFIDWSNSQIREKHGNCVTPHPDRRFGSIPQVIAKNTICKKYKESLGISPKTIFICRGGSLPSGILKYLSGFDIVVHSAYGQSESCSLLTANIPKRFCKLNSAGKPAPGVKIKLQKNAESFIDDHGDVLGFGRNIFMGYLNRENETKEVMTDDDWLKLGDTAFLDDEGFLVVTGYPKDLITLETEETINPTPIEDNVRMELPCVSHCLLVGEGRDRLGLLITLDTVVDDQGLPTNQLTPACQKWFRAARFDVKIVSDVLQNIEAGINHVIQAGIDRANLMAERASYFIIEWEIKPTCFSFNTGELGQTGKLNRKLLREKYSKQINQMFNREGGQRSVNDKNLNSDAYQPFSHQLSQIVEEEERQSSRNSLDKEQEDSRRKDVNICVNVTIESDEQIKSDENELNISNEENTMNISTDESEKTDANDSEHNVSKDSVDESDISEDSDSAQSKPDDPPKIEECLSGTVASSSKTRITRT